MAVFNDLRLPFGENDAAQIDHLLLHPFGLVLVESKSITGSVIINELGEWCRTSGGRRSGMRSPVVQARMQADALRTILLATLPGQMSFDAVPFDVLVAISDRGVIERRCQLPEVLKADVIPRQIRELILRRQAERSDDGAILDVSIRRKLADFLLARHTPLRGATSRSADPVPGPTRGPVRATVAKPPPLPARSPMKTHGVKSPRCRFCGTGALHVQHGKPGYYFCCINCTKNTPIDLTCTFCSAKGRVRKDGLNFYRDCASCRASELFYVNANLTDLEDLSGER